MHPKPRQRGLLTRYDDTGQDNAASWLWSQREFGSDSSMIFLCLGEKDLLCLSKPLFLHLRRGDKSNNILLGVAMRIKHCEYRALSNRVDMKADI